MNTNKKTAVLVGILFIIGTVAGILSGVVTAPVLGSTDLLAAVSANENAVWLGSFFVLTMGLALALVPVLMYPVLKTRNQALALGYLVFRGALETCMYIAMVIPWLFLIQTSRASAQASASEAAYLQTLGALFLKGNDAIEPVMAMIFTLGALMFYAALYQAHLLPRWLSGWGLAAAAVWLLMALAAFFQLVEPQATFRTAFALPIFLQEMVMAVWLIVKGFDSTAILPAHVNRMQARSI